jgi:tetratricopeptide (TPR) repeat protein
MLVDTFANWLDRDGAEMVRAWVKDRQNVAVVQAPPAAWWPFLFPLVTAGNATKKGSGVFNVSAYAEISTAPDPFLLPSSPVIVWMPQIHEAFVNHQTANTRLVTTQPLYLMQVWLDAVAGRDDVLLVATADADALAEHAPEAAARRGPFASPLLQLNLTSTTRRQKTGASHGETAPKQPEGDDRAIGALMAAMRTHDAAERLAFCVRALSHGRTPPALLAAASVCMEVNDLEAAARDLDEALAQAPEWAAAHFERGKLWLRLDDMERASESFRTAAALMPAFPSAWANLGATLGELDRPDEALAAFEQALRHDPTSHQALNNIGVVHRELGKLADSESAFRRVTQLAPSLAAGYYNLGHTLFLQGRYQAALSAYVEGQKRDPERNPVQASRLALCRLATGDAAGALDDLQRVTTPLPREYKRQLLADTNAVVWALLTHRPDLAGWKQVADWLARELATLDGATSAAPFAEGGTSVPRGRSDRRRTQDGAGSRIRGG